MATVEIRDPSHAGSWYSADRKELSAQLDDWLDRVESPIEAITRRDKGPIEPLPVPGARVIIAPHAGYAYSGPAAAWAYKTWDVSGVERVFLLGPSHHHYLERCALSKLDEYATPLGNLVVDRDTTQQLFRTGQFEYMSQSVDEAEHSLEMHLPYIFKILSRTFSRPDRFPKLVPIMVGNTRAATEVAIGRILSPYLCDIKTAFVVSSDFAHWGKRFGYTYYMANPDDASSAVERYSAHDSTSGKRRDHTGEAGADAAPAVPIHESIRHVDFECIRACETGRHGRWTDVLARTGNTVCGRHPIGCVLAGIEQMERSADARDGTGTRGVAGEGTNVGRGRFTFVRYDRSGLVTGPHESSVSYASAFAVL